MAVDAGTVRRDREHPRPSLPRGARLVLLLGLGFGVLGVLLLFLEPLDVLYGTDNTADALGVALVLGATVPLALVRVAPLRVLCVVLASSVSAILLGYPATTTIASSLLAIGCAAYETDRRTSIGIGAICATTVAAAITDPGIGPSPVINALFGGILGAVPALVGDALRTQAALTDSVRRNAFSLQQLSETETRQAVMEERVRIARDVHDTVGHHLAAIALHAGAGSRVVTDPVAVGGILETIKDQSSAALLQTRHMLGLLRDGEVDRSPTPGVADVEALLETTRRAGVRVAFCSRGAVRELPGIVDTTTYRILQEALTNVTKHARPAEARVEITYSPGSVRVLIDDNGRSANSATVPGAGHGLVGMRERVALVGGELSAGRRAEGGWRIAATLPTGRPLT